MANPSALASHWVGDPQRITDELCPECFTSALIWVPYYSYIGDSLLSAGPSLLVLKRTKCGNCGYVVNESA